ncbi:MAG: hypothetical protein RBU30_24545, partial [Polyangia bacterium]|nr:hypothetical protein [Polyangia bacterium]
MAKFLFICSKMRYPNKASTMRHNARFHMRNPTLLVTALVTALHGLLVVSCSDDDGGDAPMDASMDASLTDSALPDGAQPDAALVDASPADAAGFVCDPPAVAGSLFELEAEFKSETEPVSMCQHRGKVLLTHEHLTRPCREKTWKKEGSLISWWLRDQTQERPHGQGTVDCP